MFLLVNSRVYCSTQFGEVFAPESRPPTGAPVVIRRGRFPRNPYDPCLSTLRYPRHVLLAPTPASRLHVAVSYRRRCSRHCLLTHQTVSLWSPIDNKMSYIDGDVSVSLADITDGTYQSTARPTASVWKLHQRYWVYSWNIVQTKMQNKTHFKVKF